MGYENFFSLNDRIEKIPHDRLFDLGKELSLEADDSKNWRQVGCRLACTTKQMNGFQERNPQNPGFEMLKDWGREAGSTFRILKNTFHELKLDNSLKELEKIMTSE